MNPVFLELLLVASDCAEVSIESRDEIEDNLSEKLDASGLGTVSGGGGGMGIYNIDIDIYDERRLPDVLAIIKEYLVSLNVPPSTKIIRHKPQRDEFLIY